MPWSFCWAAWGMSPDISLKEFDKREKRVDRSLMQRLGVAGFAFGNMMLLSIPEYFVAGEFWLEKYKWAFRYMIFAFSIPVDLYGKNLEQRAKALISIAHPDHREALERAAHERFHG